MTTEEKAKAYDEALKKARQLCAYPTTKSFISDLQDLFPELAESEDEKVRKELIKHLKESSDWKEDEVIPVKNPSYYRQWASWLEKQGSKDKFIEKELGCIKDYRENAIKRLEELEKQGESSICNIPSKEIILAIWDLGNEWKELTGGSISTEYDTQLNYIQNHWHESEYYLKAMQNEQKLIDKVEQKFEVGDWVVWDNKISCHVDNIYQGKESLMYTITDTNNMTRSYSIKSFDNNAHLWTIQDAKDGDILTSIGFHSNCTFIFNGLDNWKFEEPNGNRVVATGYCCLTASADKMEFGIQGPDCIEVNTIKPATKIQCDLLFEKMKEVGYEWDAEKKELKKIEPKTEENKGNLGGISPNSAWSEDDETVLNNLIYALANDRIGNNRDEFVGWLKSIKSRVQPKQEWSEEDINMIDWLIRCCEEEHKELCNDKYGHQDIVSDLKRDCRKKWDWLESLKNRLAPQNTWKPSKEQMDALAWALGLAKNCGEECAFDLRTLHEQLEKLKEE